MYGLSIVKSVIEKRCLLCSVLFLILMDSAWAETRLILTAKADVSVFEANPDRSETRTTEHVLSAGIGRGLREGRLISYLRFDLSEILNSTLSDTQHRGGNSYGKRR